MDKVKQAAIILLGMGDKYAGDILKNMEPQKVQEIIEAINKLDNISEIDVIESLNAFFKEANSSSGIDIVTKEAFKNSIASVVETKKYQASGDSETIERNKWTDIFKSQSSDMIYSIVQDEHPQVIAVIAAIVLDTEKASRLIKYLPKDMQSSVVSRIAKITPVSTFGMDTLSIFFEKELNSKEKYKEISVNGVEAVANIMSYLDIDSERDIFDGISNVNTELSEMIQEKIMPFERLAQLDKKSLQALLSEVENDDLVLALKGAESYVKNVFLNNMASKSADILRDELESKGPVKIANVIDAQKRIVNLAKKLASEDKIIISTKVDSGVVY
jgi:flagellar motor switch protein FliG